MKPIQYRRHGERGATLFVSLVLLVLISLLGVAALKNASVEEQMSANLYQKNIAFQASESAVEATLDNDTLISQTLSANGTPVPLDVPTNVTGVTARVSYSYVGDGPASGFSIGNGSGFSAAHLMITATGDVPAINASTTTVHGVYRVSPSAD
jgi:Tfp pilus assembly protein PilV